MIPGHFTLRKALTNKKAPLNGKSAGTDLIRTSYTLSLRYKILMRLLLSGRTSLRGAHHKFFHDIQYAKEGL